MMNKKQILAGILLVLSTLVASADANASARASKKVGFGIGLFTEPMPSVLGFWGGYNMAPQWKVTLGYSSFSGTGFSVSIIGADLKYFFWDTNITPFLSVGGTMISGTVTGTGSGSVTATGVAPVAGLGLFEWATDFGTVFGLEVKALMNGGKVGILPGIYSGLTF